MSQNNRSSLLTSEENELILSLLGPQCQILATAVVELLTTRDKKSLKWYYEGTGVLCFVNHVTRRSHFFEFWCLVQERMIWEHELYSDMNYLAPKPFFHTFEAEDYIVAFNFADKKESLFMRSSVLKSLAIEKQRRDGIANSKRDNESKDGMSNAIKRPEEKSQTTSSKKRNKKKIKKAKKEKLTSLDIGTPQDFKHIGHVGWDSSGPSMGLTLQKFLEKAGVSDSHLKNEDTWNFILNFITENGGMEELAKTVEEDSPTPTHISSGPPDYPPPPLPPDITTDLPKIPARIRSVPPVPPRTVPLIPPSPPLPTLEALPELSPPFTSPVPDQREASSRSTVEDPRDRLLEAIRSRPELRPAEETSTENKSTNSRDDLNKKIREGVALKPVSEEQRNKKPRAAKEDLASVLREVLTKRFGDMNPDLDEKEENNEKYESIDAQWE